MRATTKRFSILSFALTVGLSGVVLGGDETTAPAGSKSWPSFTTSVVAYDPLALNTLSRIEDDVSRLSPNLKSQTPSPRSFHTAIWTGTEMLIWGGYNGSALGTGGRYNPSTDSWSSISLDSAPSPRYNHTAVWTGTEMVIWGGYDGSFLNTGGRYNPSTDTWVATNLIGAPGPRESHTAVWTGTEMVVWGGGADGGPVFNTGARYNPLTDTWLPTSLTSAPSPRFGHTAVWTGSEVLIWGGHTGSGRLNTGGRYDPSTDTWLAMSQTSAPKKRDAHTAVWTGTEMVIWGGGDGASAQNTGGRYNPSSDTWSATNTISAPVPRLDHSAVVAGSQMIIWGGAVDNADVLNTGGRYDLLTDIWSTTSLVSAASPRKAHTAIWTGSEMVVWGGFVGVEQLNTDDYLNSMGRYEPSSDAWSAWSLGPRAGFTWDPPVPTAGEPAQFTSTSGGLDLSWSWDFEGDGVFDSTVENPTLTFDEAGPYPVTLVVNNSYGEGTITHLINIAPQGDGPTVTHVDRLFPGVFLEGTDVLNRFDVAVDWRGGTPGTVSFTIPGAAPVEVPATLNGASHEFDMTTFSASYEPTEVVLVAMSAEGVEGSPWSEYVRIFPYPTWLTTAISQGNVLDFRVGSGEVTVEAIAEFPLPHLSADCTLACAVSADCSGCRRIPSWVPYLGGTFDLLETFGEFRAGVSSTGAGSVSLRGQTGFFALGGGDTGSGVQGSVAGSGQLSLRSPGGLNLTQASFTIELQGVLGKEVGIVEAIPQLASLSNLPVIGPPIGLINERVKLRGEISPELQMTATFEQQAAGGDLRFREGTGQLGIDLKGTVSASFHQNLSASAWIAGGGSITLGVPDPFVREIKANLEAGANLKISYLWVAQEVEARKMYSCRWTPAQGMKCGTAENKLARIAEPFRLRTIDIDYQRFGEYSQTVDQPLPKKGEVRVPVSVHEKAVVNNLFPGASPTLVETPEGLLLLWIHQDAGDPVQQSTEVSWSFNTLSPDAWTTPALIADDTQAEFSPTAAVDATGKVVAVWTRIADPMFVAPIETLEDLPAFYKELEIVTATFDPATQIWSETTALTSNSALDTELKLASDSTGNLMLTWLQNGAGEFLSTTENPSVLMFSLWDVTTQSWSSPSAIASQLVGVSSHASARNGSEAFVILPRDPDLATQDDGILELYTWDGITWSAPVTFASGGVENRVPSVVYDSAGEGHVVWLRDDKLVEATLSDLTPLVVRGVSDSIAFYDLQLLGNSQGNLTLIWQEVVDGGPANIFARIFDPATVTWSADRRLSAEVEVLHRDLNGFYGDDGLLRATYLATEIERVSEDVEIDGEIVTLTNLPQEGRTDLRVLEHSLIVDLATDDGELVVSPAFPESGEAVTATIVVHNAGDFAVGGFDVEAWVGGPTEGGELVASSSVESLAAGDAVTLDLAFTYPEIPGDIVVVVDAQDQVTELVETNNAAVFHVDNSPPFAIVVASVAHGSEPLTVSFDADHSFDPEDDAMSFGWAFADGSTSVTGVQVSHTFDRRGEYPVTLAVTDSKGAVGTAVVLITIPNVRPLALGDVFEMPGSGPLSVTAPGVLANDTDENFGDVLSAVLVDGPVHGTLHLAADGSFTYDPGVEFVSTDTFTYTANDGSDDSDVATVTIVIPDVFADGFETGDTIRWSSTVP